MECSELDVFRYLPIALSAAPTDAEVLLTLRRMGGTAEPGLDFDFNPFSHVTVARGQADLRMSFYAKDDGLPEGDETVQLTLEVLSGAKPGLRTNLTVVIHNSAPHLQVFAQSSVEGVAVKFRVVRTGDTNVAVSAVMELGGTAQVGVDRGLSALPSAAEILPGQREWAFDILTLDNGVVNDPKTVSLRLSFSSTGASIAPGDATAYILDNEVPATHSFQADHLSVLPDFSLPKARLPDGGFLGLKRLNNNGANNAVLLLRYDPEGNLAAIQDLSLGEQALVSGLIPLADGGAIISGSFCEIGGVARPELARLAADGTLDERFILRDDSSFTCAEALSVEPPRALLVQPDGRVIVSANNQLAPRLIRLLPDGARDKTFAETPQRLFTQSEAPQEAVAHTGGSFIVSSRSRLLRFRADGSLDDAFHAPDNGINLWFDLSVQTDGKIIAQRLHYDPNGPLFGAPSGGITGPIVRLMADGALDSDFMKDQNIFGVFLELPDGRFLVGDAHEDGLRVTLADGRPDPAMPGIVARYAGGGPVGRYLRSPVVALPNGLLFCEWGSSTRIYRLTNVPKTAVGVFRDDARYSPWEPELVIEGGKRPAGFTFKVQRVGETTLAARVRLRTSDGSARANVDYKPIDQLIEFAPFEARREAELITLAMPTNAKTLVLELSEANGFEEIAPPITVVLAGNQTSFLPGAIETLVNGWKRIVSFKPWSGAPDRMEVSNDLKTWEPLRLTYTRESRLEALDPDAPKHARRFYRTVFGPP